MKPGGRGSSKPDQVVRVGQGSSPTFGRPVMLGASTNFGTGLPVLCTLTAGLVLDWCAQHSRQKWTP